MIADFKIHPARQDQQGRQIVLVEITLPDGERIADLLTALIILERTLREDKSNKPFGRFMIWLDNLLGKLGI